MNFLFKRPKFEVDKKFVFEFRVSFHAGREWIETAQIRTTISAPSKNEAKKKLDRFVFDRVKASIIDCKEIK